MVVRFMQLVGPMTADERELLMEAAAPIPLEIVVRILDDPPEDRCSLKDARRFFSRHFKMCYDYDPFDANAPPEEASVQVRDRYYYYYYYYYYYELTHSPPPSCRTTTRSSTSTPRRETCCSAAPCWAARTRWTRPRRARRRGTTCTAL